MNVTINGVGTVRGSVVATGAELNCARDAAGVQSGTCSVFVANERICEGEIPPGARTAIPPCITFPGQIGLYAEDSGAYGFTRWDGSCRAPTARARSSTPGPARSRYSVTANFGDNAPPSVALTAPGVATCAAR